MTGCPASTADAPGRRRLQHVRTAADAGIEQERHAAANRLGDARQRVYRHRQCASRAAAMVGDNRAVDAERERTLGIRPAGHALEQDG